MKIFIIFILQIFTIFSFCFSQNSIEIKMGDRYLDTDGLKTHEEVILRYKQKYSLAPSDYRLACDLGNLYFLVKNFEKALTHYKSLYENFNSQREHIVINISRTYVEMDSIVEAIEILNSVIDTCNFCTGIYFQLGSIYQKFQLYKEAYHYYNAIDKNKIEDNYLYYYYFADLCFEADTTLEKGISLARIAVELHPEWYTYKTLGDLLYRTENYTDALAAYKIVVKDFPMPEIKEKIKRINTLGKQ